MDALVQCIEPFCTHLATPLSDVFARRGIELASGALRRAYHEPGDLEARDAMALAGLYRCTSSHTRSHPRSLADTHLLDTRPCSGLALANSKLGSVHGFAGVLGGMFPRAPHGAVCGRLLPGCWRANHAALAARGDDAQSRRALARMEEAARVVVGRPDATVEEAGAWMGDLVGELGVPGLAEW